MKIYLRHETSGMFYVGAEHFVSNREKAHAFSSTDEAKRVLADREMSGVGVVLFQNGKLLAEDGQPLNKITNRSLHQFRFNRPKPF